MFANSGKSEQGIPVKCEPHVQDLNVSNSLVIYRLGGRGGLYVCFFRIFVIGWRELSIS